MCGEPYGDHDCRPPKRGLDVAERLEDDLRSGVRESVARRSVAHARSEINRVDSMAMALRTTVSTDLSGVKGSSCFIVLLTEAKVELEAGMRIENIA